MRFQASKVEKWVLGSVGFCLAITATVVITYEINFHRTIIPKVYIGNIEVSNLKAEEAVDLVKKNINDQKLKIIVVNPNGPERNLDINSLNLKYNIEETIANAWQIGRRGNLVNNYIERLQAFSKGRTVPLAVHFDNDSLDGVVASMAAEVNVIPTKPSLSINSASSKERISFKQGSNGWMLDQDQLRKEIADNLNRLGEVRINMPLNIVSAKIDDAQVEKIKNKATALIGRDISINYKDYSKKIKGETLVEWLGFNDDWQVDKIKDLATRVAGDLDKPAQDAKFEFKDQKLVDFLPDSDGVKVDQEKLGDELVKAVSGEQNVVEVPVFITAAKVRAGEINNLGIQDLLGEGKSQYAHSIPGRIHNVALAASRINGLLIPPGETFSFVQTVGDISAATGYQSAYIIKDGKTVLGDGGGVCQVSTTLFRAILKAGLPVVERHAHAYRVGYYEQDSKPGLDATVFAPSVDLKFLNNTSKYLLLQSKADSGKLKLVIDIYGTDDGRKSIITEPKIFSQSAPGDDIYTDDPTLPLGQIKQIDYKAWGAKVGFDYSVEKGGEIMFRKSFYSNYQPWQAVFLRGTKVQ